MHADIIELRGNRLHVKRYAPLHYDTLLVFIHGGGGCAQHWQEQLDFFTQTEKYAVVAMDLLGHGGSDKPKPGQDNLYKLCDMVADVVAMVKTFSAKRVVFVGHSYGALLAIEVIRQLQDLSCGLLLFAPMHASYSHKLLLALPGGLLESVRGGLRRLFQKKAFSKNSSPEVKQQHADLEGAPLYVIKALLQGIGNLVSSVPVTVPVLLVLGEQDHILSRDAVLASYQSWPTLEVVTMTGVGHMMILEDPMRTSVVISAFLQSLSSKKVRHLHPV